jgi:hypothetical protein
MLPDGERKTLIDFICERIRLYGGDMDWNGWLEFRKRLRKTSVDVLRSIINDGAVDEIARQLGVIR